MTMNAGDCYEIIRDAVLEAPVVSDSEDDVLWQFVGGSATEDMQPLARDRAFLLLPANPAVDVTERYGCNEKRVELRLVVAYTTGNPEFAQRALIDSVAISDSLRALQSAGSPRAGGHAGPITMIRVEPGGIELLTGWLLMAWNITADYSEEA